MTGVLPSVTIIVPFYNAGETLEYCLYSIQDQDYPNVRVVLVNDGSTDGGRNVAVPFVHHHGWMLIDSSNEGLGPARNKGIDGIREGYVTFLDADDVLLPSAITALVRTASTRDAEIVYGPHFVVDWQKTVRPLPYLEWIRHAPIEKNLRDEETSCLADPVVTGKLFSVSLFNERGIRFRQRDHGEDVLFSTETWIAAARVYACTAPVYLRRPFETADASSITGRRGTLSAVQNRIQALIEVDRLALENGYTVLREHNLHTGLGQIFISVGMIDDHVIRQEARELLLEAIFRIGIDEDCVTSSIGITAHDLQNYPIDRLDSVRCRYLVFRQRLLARNQLDDSD